MKKGELILLKLFNQHKNKKLKIQKCLKKNTSNCLAKYNENQYKKWLFCKLVEKINKNQESHW